MHAFSIPAETIYQYRHRYKIDHFLTKKIRFKIEILKALLYVHNSLR